MKYHELVFKMVNICATAAFASEIIGHAKSALEIRIVAIQTFLGFLIGHCQVVTSMDLLLAILTETVSLGFIFSLIGKNKI